MPIILDRPLYLDAAKSKIVEAGDPAARFLLGGKGSTISDEDVKFYGLDKYLAGAAPEADDEPKATQPPANKMQTRDLTNKGK